MKFITSFFQKFAKEEPVKPLHYSTEDAIKKFFEVLEIVQSKMADFGCQLTIESKEIGYGENECTFIFVDIDLVYAELNKHRLKIEYGPLDRTSNHCAIEVRIERNDDDYWCGDIKLLPVEELMTASLHDKNVKKVESVIADVYIQAQPGTRLSFTKSHDIAPINI